MRDPVAIYNERVKSLAGFLTNLGLGLVGFAIIRPLIETGGADGWLNGLWGGVGLALHATSHYILGYLKKDV